MDRVNNLMVFDIMPERKVVFLEHNINVQDTLSILEDKRISSAPVRCPLPPPAPNVVSPLSPCSYLDREERR
jgi:hypothetical protein